MKVATKVNYEDVIDFFEGADLDLANLTHQLVTTKLAERVAKREAAGERMKKARAGRKPKGETAVQAGQAAPEAVVTPVVTPAPQAQPATERPHRTHQTVSA